MKLNRKGFTLIELLAVIVVLAIILVIAIPKVIDTIKNSKKGALESSVKSIIKAAGQYVAKKEVEGQTITEGYIADLDIQNKSDWEGYWVNNNGIITFQYIQNEKEEFIRQNVNATNINTEGISCGEKCIAYSSSDISTLPTDNEQLTPMHIGLNNNVLSWTGNDPEETYAGPKSIVLPNEVTTIDEWTFCESQLKYVIIPNSVTTIGEEAFSYNDLTNVVIPSSVQTIGKGAFNHNQLKSVSILKGVKTIQENAFYNNKLTSVTIPDSVTTIGSGAFSYNELTSITIPSSLSTIIGGAFAHNKLTSVTIPNTITKIYTSAFSNNLLTSVTIPDSVTLIEFFAFEYNDLRSVTIPSSVSSISNRAFAHNPNLTSIINKSGAKNWKLILGATSCTPNDGGTEISFSTGSCTIGTQNVTITNQ